MSAEQTEATKAPNASALFTLAKIRYVRPQNFHTLDSELMVSVSLFLDPSQNPLKWIGISPATQLSVPERDVPRSIVEKWK